jgi:hypothetical protein
MNTFLQIFNALPTIIQAVQIVESAIPLPQSGQQKMNLILGAAGTAWEMAQVGQELSKTGTLAAVQALTNLTVATLNAAGVFSHGTPAATPAPASSAPASPAAA